MKQGLSFHFLRASLKTPTSALREICKVLIPAKIVGTPALQISQALNLEFLEMPLNESDARNYEIFCKEVYLR